MPNLTQEQLESAGRFAADLAPAIQSAKASIRGIDSALQDLITINGDVLRAEDKQATADDGRLYAALDRVENQLLPAFAQATTEINDALPNALATIQALKAELTPPPPPPEGEI